MSTWSAGYVADIEYLPGFYREQGPSHLHLACLINGIEPPSTADGFDYCELGCGTGVTVSLLAAANPRGRFHAIDFHPAHIARANAFANEARLNNLTFHEASFEEIAAGEGPKLPRFDFITLHGVYSWISPENRRAIVRFLNRALKPGGLVYVTYNTQPGWASVTPLQRLLQEYSALVHDRSDRQVVRALEFAQALQKAGSPVLGDEEQFRKLHDAGKSSGGQQEHNVYLAHEYLNENWHPLYHADVAREMAAAKLSFVGSGTLLENFPDLSLRPEQRQILDTVPVPMLRETFKDYCTGQPFRRDIYVRGARHLPPARREALLRRMGLALAVPRGDASLTIKTPLSEAELNPAQYGPVLDALAERPHGVGELLNLPAVQGGTMTAVELAGILVGSHQVLPMPHPAGEPLPSVLRFNRAQATAGTMRKKTGLAASVGGSGLHLSTMETLLYEGLALGLPAALDPLLDHVLDRISGGGPRPEANDENHVAITDSLAWCLEHSLPVWKRLGMI